MMDWRLRNSGNIVVPDFSDAISGLAQSLDRKREKKRAHEEYKRQNDLIEEKRRQEAEDRAYNRSKSYADEQSAAVREIGELADQGRLSEAEALATARGVEFNRGGMVTDPDALPEAPKLTPSWELPPQTGLKMNIPGLTVPMAKDGADEEGAPPQRSGFAEWLTGKKAPQLEEPPPAEIPRRYEGPTMTVGGRKIGLDPEGAQRREDAKNQRLIDRAKANSEAVAARQEDQQAFLAGEKDEDRALRLQLKSMGGAKNKPADERGEKRLGLQEETAARALAKDVLSGLGYREQQASNRKFNEMAANLSATPNAALDAVTAGSFVKMAQGGTGVLSDSDMRQFWGNIGGLGIRSEEMLNRALSGELGPEKRAEVLAAVKSLASNARARLDEIRSGMEHAFSSSPHLSKYKDQMVGTYFPEARAPKPAASPGGNPQRQAQLLEWARRNPNDKRAQAIKQKLGGR